MWCSPLCKHISWFVSRNVTMTWNPLKCYFNREVINEIWYSQSEFPDGDCGLFVVSRAWRTDLESVKMIISVLGVLFVMYFCFIWLWFYHLCWRCVLWFYTIEIYLICFVLFVCCVVLYFVWTLLRGDGVIKTFFCIFTVKTTDFLTAEIFFNASQCTPL